MTEPERSQSRQELFGFVVEMIEERGWHWFAYHFCGVAPTHFARTLIDACVDCETNIPGLGRDLIRDIGRIGGVEGHEPHYEQLLQKLAELLVLRQLLVLPWPEGTTFAHEPTVNGQGPRPELKASVDGLDFLFEVKAPSLTLHGRNRGANDLQLPARVFDREDVERLAGAGGLTLPRDNPVKDFLVDANRKFARFKAEGRTISILIIVWDDFIQEPISVLTHERCGLLTPQSYFKDARNLPVIFPNIDAVILVRHLTYFSEAAAERPMPERQNAFDFGDEQSLPNVLIPVQGGEDIPEFIIDGLRAYPLDHGLLRFAADYHAPNLIIWI